MSLVSTVLRDGFMLHDLPERASAVDLETMAMIYAGKGQPPQQPQQSTCGSQEGGPCMSDVSCCPQLVCRPVQAAAPQGLKVCKRF